MGEEFRRQAPLLKRALEKMVPEHREWIAWDIRRVLSLSDHLKKVLGTDQAPTEICTIESALLALGVATAQVTYINKIHARIQELSGTRFFTFPRELYDLREHCMKQVDLCMQLVYAIAAKEMPLPKKEATPV